MTSQLRILWAILATIALLPGLAWADAWDPPAGYYDGATGTGATLKSQLTTIMSTGHIQRSYGDFRYSAALSDQDPNNPSNILLVYNRASVPATWDLGNTWNREHTWPDSLQPGNASNGAFGAIGDPHMLRPCNPSINNSRGNKPYGLDATTGTFGAVSGGYYYPGDTDKGDMARTMFYMATRWSSDGLTLVEGLPVPNQMGDLSSLVAWNFLDVPDEFERRRNHVIYSQAYNPTYYTNNRNAYVDHPEFVWSVFVDQNNDSQITIDGGSVDGSGGSTRDVDLGRVFVGGAVPAAQNFTLNKGGDDGTYYEVTAAGAATSSINGHFNAFRTNGTDSSSITVGLDPGTSTALAGLKSGTVTVDNLDVTTGFGSGHGAQDGNDLFNVSLDVLDHAAGSFNGSTQVTSLMYDFGSISMGAADPIYNFALYNLESTAGYTAALDFDSLMTSGDTGVLSTDLAAAAGSLSLDGGTDQGFSVTFDTASAGMFSATYTLMVSDEDLTGELTDSLTLTVMGEIVASATLPGDYNGNDVVDAADYAAWRDAITAGATELLNDPTPGTVDESDFAYWRDHFGEVLGSGAGSAAGHSTSAVPEPAGLVLLLFGSQALLLAVRRAG